MTRICNKHFNRATINNLEVFINPLKRRQIRSNSLNLGTVHRNVRSCVFQRLNSGYHQVITSLRSANGKVITDAGQSTRDDNKGTLFVVVFV